MIPRRFAIACVAALAVVLSAPFAQQMVDVILSRWPGRFRAIALTATLVPIAASLILAIRRVRDRRLLRYGALASSVVVATAYVFASDLTAAEIFHFVEYGVVALLFYRAFLPAGDISVILIPLLAGVTTGVLDEWLQWFVPIRTGEVRDVALNLVAVVCGLLFAVGVEPPVAFRLILTPRSRPLAACAAAVTLLTFALFTQSVRASHEIRDDEVGSFMSRYSPDDLQALRRDREERWRAAPPVMLRRLSREDQFLAEAISHVRRRNQAWGAGDIATAWRENRILERHYAPVLDTPSYISAAGHRWPEAQRAEAAARAAPASLIIHNARIYTMDARSPLAEAIAIRGDRIVRVGDSDEVLPLGGASTRVIDAAGAAVVPGLHDAHGHFAELGANLRNLDFRGTTSYQQIVDMVRQRVAAAGRDEWILGRSWDQNDWPDKQWPTHEALSVVSPLNPVVLTRVDGHATLANRRALEIAGVTRATPDPDGGRIMRSSSGEPTGVLIDRAQGLVESRIPPLAPTQLDAQILRADEETRRLGLTTVHDAGATREEAEAYRRLVDGGLLKTRLYVMMRGSLPELRPLFDRGPVTDDSKNRLVVRAIKISADGALGSRGAAMFEPYSDEPGTTGLLITPPDDVYAQTVAASKAGFQTAVHAIGDRANRIVLDIFERVQREVPAARGLRLRVEHAQILDAADIPRFSRLGVIASMQPTHATSDMPWVPARIGRARMEEGAYVWQTLLASGALLVSGSDFPVEEPNPMLGFYAAITRQDRSGNPQGGLMPGERLSREQALRSFTLDAAYAAHAETLTGSLEAGKLADLVMLSNDIMQVPAKDVLATTVRATVVGGEVVYQQP